MRAPDNTFAHVLRRPRACERGPHRHRRRGPHANGRLSWGPEGCDRAGARRARDCGRGRAGGARGGKRRRDPDGLRPAGWSGPGAGASGGDRRGPAHRGGRDHGQQDVRLRHEGGDGRPRPFVRRLGGCGGRGRHGEHEQRALSARSRPHRLPDGPRPHHRSYVPGRPRGRLRQGAPDGDVRRGLRPEIINSPARRRTLTRSPRSSAPTVRSNRATSPGRSPPSA